MNCDKVCTPQLNANVVSNSVMRITRTKSDALFVKSVSFKELQQDSLSNLSQTLKSTINVLQSANSSSVNGSELFGPEAIRLINQYNNFANRKSENLALMVNSNPTLYGTVDASGNPVCDAAGMGGIAADNTLSAIKVNNITFTPDSGDDVAYMADRIRNYFNNDGFAVVDGCEFSIELNGASSEILDVTIHSTDLGDVTSSITLDATTEVENYETLKQRITTDFANYIEAVWVDTAEMKLRVILKRGYTVEIASTATADNASVATYVNGTSVAESTVLSSTASYLIGYLLLFTFSKSFKYNFTGAESDSSLLTAGTDCLYFNLAGAFAFISKTVFSFSVSYGNDGGSPINLQSFLAYGQILSKMIYNLDYDLLQYSIWRRNNVIGTLDALMSFFESATVLVQNQRDNLQHLRRDFNMFISKNDANIKIAGNDIISGENVYVGQKYSLSNSLLSQYLDGSKNVGLASL